MDRDKTIIKVSIQGIIVNLILVAFKGFVGLMSNSIAVLLDAVNNLSDALSQVITIVGTKLSAKAPNKEHPYGYGRIEYLSSVIIAVMILIAGGTSLKESILKVIHPEESEYTAISLVIIVVAVVVKFFFGRYVKGTGEKLQSQALIASGTEGSFDAILSFFTLVAAIVNIFFHVTLEGWIGAILSVFIIRAGLESLMETLSSIIGGRADSELTLEIKKFIREFEGVNGAYDLVLHEYGASRSMGTVHIEVDDTMSAADIHHLTRDIMAAVLEKFGIALTVGIYASNTADPKHANMRVTVAKIAKRYEHVMQMHGFYVDEKKKLISFDLLISFHAKSVEEIRVLVEKDVLEEFPGYHCHISIDHDFSD